VDLDDVVAQLNQHQKRASYGAVAGVLGVAPRGLMARRPKNHRNSWLVAATTNQRTGSRRGWPTGYTDDQIDPDCLRQIDRHPDDFIKDKEVLRQWLFTHK